MAKSSSLVSAGNEGATGYQSITNGAATYGTIASPAYTPSVIAAGGIQNDVTYAMTIKINGPGVPANLATLNGFSGGGVPVPTTPLTAPLVDVTQIGANTLLCSAPAAGSLNGDIALISRGTCEFINKITNAASAGAVGVIIFNDVADQSILTSWGAAGASLPAFMISESDGQSLQSYVDGNSAVSATLSPTLVQVQASTAGFTPGFNCVLRLPRSGDGLLRPETRCFRGGDRLPVGGRKHRSLRRPLLGDSLRDCRRDQFFEPHAGWSRSPG